MKPLPRALAADLVLPTLRMGLLWIATLAAEAACPAPAQAACLGGGASCSLVSDCCFGVCSDVFSGTCPSCRASKQSCGIGSICCNGLLCDAVGVCRHNPPEAGEPCGLGVPCKSPLACSATIGGTCIACGSGTDPCTGLGQGTCCNDLLCDVLGECRHVPSASGELCGLGVPCAGSDTCQGGRCQACRPAKSSCSGVGQGSCCTGLECDFTGECRHPKPLLGEPCGSGVPCADGNGVCSATVGGRCVESSPEACSLISPSCADERVCDLACGECREDRPVEGEVCGLDGLFGPQCADGLTCRLSLPCSRCDAEKGLGESCATTQNCEDGLQCWPFEQKCYPEGGEGLFPAEFCLAIYSPTTHRAAIASGIGVAYGLASSLGAGVIGTTEIGGLYGADGSYGCFVTACVGGEPAAGITSAACVSLVDRYESFNGPGVSVVQSVGILEGVSVSSALHFDPGATLTGAADCIGFGAGVSLPLSVGVYQCETVVETLLARLTTTTPELAGDADGSGTVTALDALIALKLAIGSLDRRCPLCLCDLNASGAITASDALLVLRLAVGQAIEVAQVPCPAPI